MAAFSLEKMNFYKEYQGIDHLSKTFQSNLAFAPGDIKRRSISQDNFRRQRDQENRVPKTPWGRKFSYGGIGPVCLPDNHRPKTEPPLLAQKGHRHLSSGACIHPLYVPTGGKYALTSLRKSNLRASDELIESPTMVDVTKHVIDLPFPAEHPYATHIPRTSMFPVYDVPANLHTQHTVDIPQSAPDSLLISKSRGSAYRHERILVPEMKKPKPVEWIEGPNFFQLPKREKNKQNFYPTPIKSLDPNMKAVTNMSAETERALRELRTTQSTSTYQRAVEQEQTPTVKDADVLVFESNETEKDVTSVTGYVEKSAQIVTEDTAGVETVGEHSGGNVEFTDELARPSQLATTESSKSKALSPGRAKSFVSASYPPLRSKETHLNAEGTGNNHKGPQECYDELARGWSRSDIHRQFNCTHKERTLDLRRKPDLRITTNERRHRFPDFGNLGSEVWDGLSVPYRKGIVVSM